MKKIFNGGYPSPSLPNGLKACNTGAHFQIDGETFEAMNPDYSGHPSQIISKYIRVPSGGKVEISGWFNKGQESMTFGIAYYRDDCSTHSFRYTNNIPTKWENQLPSIEKAYSQIFEK